MNCAERQRRRMDLRCGRSLISTVMQRSQVFRCSLIPEINPQHCWLMWESVLWFWLFSIFNTWKHTDSVSLRVQSSVPPHVEVTLSKILSPKLQDWWKFFSQFYSLRVLNKRKGRKRQFIWKQSLMLWFLATAHTFLSKFTCTFYVMLEEGLSQY